MEPPPPSSRVTIVPRHPNANTRLPGAVEPRTFARAALREAIPVAEALARALPVGQPGYRLVWSSGALTGSLDVPATDGTYAIVGRHSCCDVVLDRDPEIALRQLLVRAERDSEGAPMLRLLDLNTSLPVRLADGSAVSSALICGPVAVRLGRYSLVALPNGTEAPPDPMPEPIVEHCTGSPYRVAASRPLGTSHVSIVPRASMLDEVAPAARGVARITLVGSRSSASLDLSDEMLDRGILVGRAPKCHVRLSPILDTSISRVHLLVLRERDRVFAFDLASMNGTFANHRRLRRIELDRPMTLTLGTAHIALHWSPGA